MSLSYIRSTYNIPAKRGARVRFTGNSDRAVTGTITGASGHLLRIRLDGEQKSRSYHPTWRLIILENNI